MTRSSRHKSHKQSKRSSRDDREYSDSEGDGRTKEVNGKDEGTVRVSRDLGSSEKRKLVSQSRDGNDMDPSSYHGNDDAPEEHGSSRRRRDRADGAGADRWNGGGEEKGSKSKGSGESKSKTGRRHDGGSEKKEEIVNEKDESKSARVDSKGKLEKDSGRKEYGSEKDRKAQDGDGEAKRRHGSQLVDFGEDRRVKRLKIAESPPQDDSRNPELEKELEKRMRRRSDVSSEKGKYQDDTRENHEKQSVSRSDHTKNDKYRDERQKCGSDRDKYRDDIDRDYRHSDGKHREDVDREKRHRDDKYREDKYRDDKYRDDRASRDYPSDKYDSKHTRDENNASESRHRKLRSHNNDLDVSPVYDDRRPKYKDDKERRRYDGRGDQSDLRSRSTKEPCYDAEKRSSTGIIESDPDRGRSYSRHIDLDSGVSHNRRKRSPNSSSHDGKDQHRQSKQAEAKFRNMVSEERSWSNVVSTKDITAVSGVLEDASVCQSVEKSLRKDDNYLHELSAERCPNSDARFSPPRQVEKSPSSSTDRRYYNRAIAWQSKDTEDSRRGSSGSKDATNYSGNELKGGRDLLLQTHSGDELSQVDGDNLTSSSPFGRNHLSTNTKSFPLPPPSAFGSSEDDSRGMSYSRDKRIGDSSTGRAWKGTPNWASPVANGFIPFPHGPPPLGFHPVMQQFPAPSMFGIRPSRELNHTRVPYHVPDSDRFPGHARPFGWRNPMDDSCTPPLHAWDANNGVMVNDSRMYGRLDWDHNRSMMSSQGWEASVDMWKQNGGVAPEVPSLPYKEDDSVSASADVAWPVQLDQVALNHRSENVEPDLTTGAAKGTSEASENLSEETHKASKILRDDRAPLSHFYLAKLEISKDLTQPELYDRCSSLMEEQVKTVANNAFQPEHTEVETGVRLKFSSNPSTSIFAAIDDSVFQRALSLYKRQKEEAKAIFPSSLSIRTEAPSPGADNMEHVSVPNQEEGLVLSSSKQEKSGEAVPASDMELVEDAADLKLEKDLTDFNTVEPDPTNMPKMEVDPVLDQVTSAAANPTSTEDNNSPSAIPGEHKQEVNSVRGSLLLSNVSAEACEGEMPESIDSGSVVNFSRIHQSQSTH